MNFNFENFFKDLPKTPEEAEQRQKESYERTKENPENMSFWLPKILKSSTVRESTLQVPETKIIQLDFEWWKWLISDRYTEEKTKEFNDYLVEQIGDFRMGEALFMKTGVFSNKFNFSTTFIDDNESVGDKFLDMFYTSMMVGADNTSEVVFRQMVKDTEGRLKIYGGMPLHTEFRVFYDFDTKEVVGISNYWHPDVMVKENMREENDFFAYEKQSELIISEFNDFKEQVAKEVATFMNGVTELKGKWSVDIMKNGDDYWLIDMARMERSALVRQIETL